MSAYSYRWLDRVGSLGALPRGVSEQTTPTQCRETKEHKKQTKKLLLTRCESDCCGGGLAVGVRVLVAIAAEEVRAAASVPATGVSGS